MTRVRPALRDLAASHYQEILQGFVDLFDKNGKHLLDRSGVIVQIDGNPNINAFSNFDGKWSLNNISTGIYSISFSKPGFGLMKVINVQFAGGGNYYLNPTYLYPKPEYEVESFSIQVAGSNEVIASGRISSSSSSIYGDVVCLFFGSASNVSSNPKDYIYYTDIGTYSSVFYQFNIPIEILKQSTNFSSGMEVFVAVYSRSPAGTSMYPDTSMGRWYITSIGDSSKTDSFIMP